MYRFFPFAFILIVATSTVAQNQERHVLECVFQDKGTSLTIDSSGVSQRKYISFFIKKQGNDSCMGNFSIDIKDSAIIGVNLSLNGCDSNSVLGPISNLVFSRVRPFDSIRHVAFSENFMLRIELKDNGEYVPFKLAQSNVNSPASWQFNFRKINKEEQLKLANQKIKGLEQQVKQLTDELELVIQAKSDALDSIQMEKKQDWINREVPYEQLDKLPQIENEAIAFVGKLYNKNYELYFSDTSNIGAYQVKENFIFKINLHGKMDSVIDKRAEVSQNTLHLSPDEISSFEELLFIAGLKNGTSVTTNMPVEFAMQMEKFVYDIKVKDDKIRRYRVPLFVEYLDEDGPHAKLIRKSLVEKNMANGRYTVTIYDGDYAMYDTKAIGFNPFSSRGRALIKESVLKVVSLLPEPTVK